MRKDINRRLRRRGAARQDYDFLKEHGVAAIFGPGTNVLDAARAVLDLMEGSPPQRLSGGACLSADALVQASFSSCGLGGPGSAVVSPLHSPPAWGRPWANPPPPPPPSPPNPHPPAPPPPPPRPPWPAAAPRFADRENRPAPPAPRCCWARPGSATSNMAWWKFGSNFSPSGVSFRTPWRSSVDSMSRSVICNADDQRLEAASSLSLAFLWDGLQGPLQIVRHRQHVAARKRRRHRSWHRPRRVACAGADFPLSAASRSARSFNSSFSSREPQQHIPLRLARRSAHRAPHRRPWTRGSCSR